MEQFGPGVSPLPDPLMTKPNFSTKRTHPMLYPTDEILHENIYSIIDTAGHKITTPQNAPFYLPD